jgi:hypothetical protein
MGDVRREKSKMREKRRRRTVFDDWIEEFAIFLELDLDSSWVLEIGWVGPVGL